MFNGNNIVITIIHRLSDSDNLLFYYYYFILIIILLYTTHVIVTSGRMCMRLWLENKTVQIPIWCPPVGTSDHTCTVVPDVCIYIRMCVYERTKRSKDDWKYIFKLLSIYYHSIVKLSSVQTDRRTQQE